MKHSLTFLLLTILISTNVSSQKLFPQDIYEFIENPEITQLNQEPGRNLFVPFMNEADALSGNKQSELFYSLNGSWKFSWSENYEKSNKIFFTKSYNDKNWDAIHVPGNWEMQGYGDKMFRNISHPFVSNPPFVPKDYNPVGLYRKTFKLPKNWDDKQVYLNFEGISSASFVWVNGHEVGYNAGAFEPSEYNITRYLNKGENNISVQVFKYSAGTYLEDQDYWRLSGIFRDAYLVATPNVHIQDFSVITDLDNEYRNAILTVNTIIKNVDTYVGNFQVEASLFDNQKKLVSGSLISQEMTVSGNGTESVILSADISNPEKWTSETPNLYTLILKLTDASGNITQVLTQKIGFREIELKHQALLVNGAPVKLNGVNSHMQHPVLGHAMDLETIRKDIILMKQFNINCVRTSHYPPNKEYLDIANELGMYVVDETGDESHATEYISELDEWTAAYIDRVQRMVLRDRSNPCIIFWSAGNESGFGNNICEVIKEGKKLDPTRLWMYGGNTDDPEWANEVPCEEIIGPRYPTPAEFKYRIALVPEEVDPRPSFMDEYVAATGNGMGGMDEYWDIIWEYPRCIGGAVWDWVSPGLNEKVRLLKDESQNQIMTAINGPAQLITIKEGSAIQLNGFDQWVDVYRHPVLDITGDQLTLSLSLTPRSWNGNGSFLTKGSRQYGIIQKDKDSIQFYVGTTRAGILTVKIPDNWYGNRHHLAGIYDGNFLEIYIDGILVGRKIHSGKIINRPFPVNLGRDAEIVGQEYSGRHSNAIIDQVIISDKAVPINGLMMPDEVLRKAALLSLSFNTVEEKGEFFSLGNDARSYGLIWPDRKPQPELWQVKKSAQPIHTEIIESGDGLFEITNRHRFTNLDEFQILWKLFADDVILSEGDLNLSVAPMESIQTKIPFQLPEIIPGVEYRLLISFQTSDDKPWAKKGFEVAWDEFPISHKKDISKNPVIESTAVSYIESDELLIISGQDFKYTFNKLSSELVSVKFQGKEMITNGPKLNVWRAPLANELDAWTVGGANLINTPGMGNDVANAWRTLGLDQLTYHSDNFSFKQKDDNTMVIYVSSHSEGINYKTIFEEHYTYEISGDGQISVNHKIVPQGYMPAWIPCIGNKWIINQELKNVIWYGRGPFENYPDRKTGAKTGIYKSTVKEMEEAYLLPQDYGLRTDNRWVRLESGEGYGLEFTGEKWFDFSAQSFDTDNLSRARLPFQLQPANGITFNFNYATSGVGCTAISVLNQYRVATENYNFNFKIRPYKKITSDNK